MPELTYNDLVPSNKVGIRSQLINMYAKRLERNYAIERSPDSLYVLNAISPTFTSTGFAEWIVDQPLTV